MHGFLRADGIQPPTGEGGNHHSMQQLSCVRRRAAAIAALPPLSCTLPDACCLMLAALCHGHGAERGEPTLAGSVLWCGGTVQHAMPSMHCQTAAVW
eukprot:CAMPEP_0174694860 /NCGR_PEP_ID=MMETSP1094-20130205/1352_1 /TAXON_ID=156173 /ORGANISM="Chrysochromulina brevifilum, Strain UTEX LB 985" /LENGTH=96 /DNA_ID=CAMNT_0015891207 /DNA_START=68 /DNA_END=355 /DNA_ORIENTATION=-